MTNHAKEQATDALRTQFEALASDHAYGFRRSRRGTYTNPATARDWKWFLLGASQKQQPAPATQQEAQEPTAISEAIERMAADRYKVVPSHESMFHRWAVVAGTGTQQLYLGREVECRNMARKFAGAFLDGAFVAMQQAAPQPSPAAQGDALSDEAIRVPLDSLHADAAYLIGRLREGSMSYARVIEIIRERIDAAKAAIRARAEQGDARLESKSRVVAQASAILEAAGIWSGRGWTTAQAYDVAQAGIDAVKQWASQPDAEGGR